MAINRIGLKDADRVYGSVEELAELKVLGQYMTCGDGPGPVCKHAAICGMPWKGLKGQTSVVAVDPATLEIKRDASGTAIREERAACGPKNMAVYRRDAFTDRNKVMFLDCVRYYNNLGRWGQSAGDGRKDIVAVLAVEGDGKLIPLKETEERIVGTMKNGAPKFSKKHVLKKRAVPFYERPVEVLADRVMDLEIESMLKTQEVARTTAIIAGLPPEMKPVDLIETLPPQRAGEGSIGIPASVDVDMEALRAVSRPAQAP